MTPRKYYVTVEHHGEWLEWDLPFELTHSAKQGIALNAQSLKNVHQLKKSGQLKG